ncbi:hypothetical protein [Streptomyces sp. MH13]
MDVLVNNAGILGEVTAPEDMTADQVRHVHETDVNRHGSQHRAVKSP